MTTRTKGRKKRQKDTQESNVYNEDIEKYPFNDGLFPSSSSFPASTSYNHSVELHELQPDPAEQPSSTTKTPPQSVFPLFPAINYNVKDDSYPAIDIEKQHDNLPGSFHPLHASSSDSLNILLSTTQAVTLIDDAASSICIDDMDVDFKSVALAIKRELDGNDPTSSSSKNRRFPRSSITDNAFEISQTGHSSIDSTDFAAYQKRVAEETLMKERIERQTRRRLRRKPTRKQPPLTDDSGRFFGNYFSSNPIEALPPDTTTVYQQSHMFDSFNGQRQDRDYNHQLNILSARLADQEPSSTGNKPNSRYEPSFMTMNIDEDSTGLSDSSDLLDDHEGSSARFVEFSKQKANGTLDRGLMSRHLQIMAFGGFLGVGSLLTIGESLFLSGPLGTLIGISITGMIVYCVMLCIGEMVSLIPTETGLSGLASRFVDDSFGFALGVCHWFCYAMALPAEVTAGVLSLMLYPALITPSETTAVWLISTLILVLFVNMVEVRFYGEMYFFAGIIHILAALLMLIFLFVLNAGKVGPLHENLQFTYWTFSKSDFTIERIYGAFRPVFPLGLSVQGSGPESILKVAGIAGSVGRFVQSIMGCITTVYPYVGLEGIFVTVGEARNPRRSLPHATYKIFWRILLFYVLGCFAIGLCVYAGDIRLSPPRIPSDITPSQFADLSISASYVRGVSCRDPTVQETQVVETAWIIALQDAGLCVFSCVANAIYVLFSVWAAAGHLYTASRVLYTLAIQGKVWPVFGRCTSYGVPYVSVLFSFLFSALAFISVNTTSFKVFHWLASLCTMADMIVWAGMAFSFLRFFKALKVQSSDHINRNAAVYPFKSPFQPYLAYFGLAGNLILIIICGFSLFLKDQWNVSEFICRYVTLALFIICYGVHKLVYKTKLVPLNKVDLDTGRKEMDQVGWAEDRVSQSVLIRSIRELFGLLRWW